MSEPEKVLQAEWIVEGVPRDSIHHVWADAWPYLESAIKRFPQVSKPYSEENILADLVKGTSQLWIGWSVLENRLVGALITDISQDAKFPGAKFLSIPLVGAEHWMKWGDTLWNVLKSWGAHKGCTHALGYGRKGWTRLYGFSQVGTTSDGIPVFMRKLK